MICTKLIHKSDLFEAFLLLELYVQVVGRTHIVYTYFWGTAHVVTMTVTKITIFCC